MADVQSLDYDQDDLASTDDESTSIMPRRRLEDTEMDITPMIDITFLLLIFFLVAAKLDEGADIPLPPAKYGVPVPSKNAVVLTVEEGEPDRPARVYKGDAIDPAALVSSRDLEALEQEITAYVTDEVAQNSQKTYVLIKAAEKVKHRDVARVANAVGRVAEIQQLHVAVLEVQ